MKNKIIIKILDSISVGLIYLIFIGSMLFLSNLFMHNIRETEGWYIASGLMVIIACPLLLITLEIISYLKESRSSL